MGLWWRRWVYRTRSEHVGSRFGLRSLLVSAVLLTSWIVAVVATPGFASSWVGPVVGVPVLLLWRVRIGAVTGVLFAAADVLLATDAPQHALFIVHGVLSLLGYVVVGRSVRARAAPEEPARRHAYFDDGEPCARRRRRPGLRTWCAGVALVVVATAVAEGQGDVGAWLVAAAFGIALVLALEADRRRERPQRTPVYAF